MGDREEGKGTGDRIWDRGVVEGDKHIGEGSGSRGGEGGKSGSERGRKREGAPWLSLAEQASPIVPSVGRGEGVVGGAAGGC